jgi:DNA primase
MLDRLSEILGMNKESIDELLKEAPPEPPPADYGDMPPMDDEEGPPMDMGAAMGHGEPQRGPGPGGRFNHPAGGNFSPRASHKPRHKPNSLKAIELLLRNPELALGLEQDLEPLRNAEDESRKLLLSLIEMVRRDPHTETSTLLGYCYGTTLGGQLTQLLKSEKITPVEGMEQEFKQIIDSILSDIRKKLELLQLKDVLKSRVAAAGNGANSATKDQN